MYSFGFLSVFLQFAIFFGNIYFEVVGIRCFSKDRRNMFYGEHVSHFSKVLNEGFKAVDRIVWFPPKLGDLAKFELKYDWSRRFQFEFEWIELTIVDNKLGRNGQLAEAGRKGWWGNTDNTDNTDTRRAHNRRPRGKNCTNV